MAARRKIVSRSDSHIHWECQPRSSLRTTTNPGSLAGYKVVTARDGEMVLAEFRRAQPDLLLLDVNMPKLRGTEVCRRIKSNPETLLVPIVLITALTATQDRVAGIEAGADDFLNKPVKREPLITRVRSLLRLKAFTDELERAEAVIFALARSIEGKDPYTQGHCEGLADYSARLGEHMGLPEEEIRALRRAGIVHDILLDFILHDVEGSGSRKGWFVRTLGAQGIVNIHDLQYSHGEGNLHASEPVRIPRPVHLLMVMANDRLVGPRGISGVRGTG